ncbi:uncharacterized protein KZ484_015024 [Pholidichthys leucotaenia]
MKLPTTTDVPQQNDFKQEEVLDEQQLLNQERDLIVVQVEADCSQIKEEQEDVCISQEGEQVGLKQETQTFDEDLPEQRVCEDGFSPNQQLWNQEENSGLKQEEPEPPQVKEEQEEVCSSQESELLIVKLEADTFMVTPVSGQSDAEPNSKKLLSHNSAVTEIQDEEGSQYVDWGSTKEEEEPKLKRRLTTRSHHDDTPQLHGCKEEVITEELCTNQEEEHFGPKQETDSFMLIPTDEDNNNSETKPNSEQFFSLKTHDIESQDQGAAFIMNAAVNRLQ